MGVLKGKSPVSYVFLRVFVVIAILVIIERLTSYHYWQTNGKSMWEAASTWKDHALAAPPTTGGGDKLPVGTYDPVENVPFEGDAPAADPPSNPDGTASNLEVEEDNDPSSKGILAAIQKKGEASWIQAHLKNWMSAQIDLNTIHPNTTNAKNQGYEGIAYLTYIINHYDELPDYVAFIHGQRYQRYNEDPMYDLVSTFSRLNLAHVAEAGYANLRCTWRPGCPNGLRPDARLDDDWYGLRKSASQAIQQLFPGDEVPRKIGDKAGGQFIVTRERIQSRSVSDYERYRHWLWTTKLSEDASQEVMEYMWHIIFGMPAQLCMPAKECFCNLYKLCDLTCPGPGTCDGRYWMPPFKQEIPNNWPVITAQLKENGWPVEGWWLTNQDTQGETGSGSQTQDSPTQDNQ